MPKSTSDLLSIISLGGGIIIDASTKSTSDIISLVKHAVLSETMIILKNADKKSTNDLLSIVKLAPGKVICEL